MIARGDRDGADLDLLGRPNGTGVVELTRSADFTLGPLWIRPPTCEVEAPGVRIRLQPRVMQVLVALAQAQGTVLSRADLVDRCWAGLAVGEDAINRCIARLRRLGDVEAPGAFSIETLPRVGYRLNRVEASPAALDPSAGQLELVTDVPLAHPADGRANPLARRHVWALAAVGFIAVVAAAVGFASWRPPELAGAEPVALAPFATAAGDTASAAVAAETSEEITRALVPTGIKPVFLKLPATPASDGGMVLRGRVEAVETDVHASVSLADARDGQVLWAGDFNEKATDLHATGEEIAEKVADVLYCALDESRFASRRYDPVTLGLLLNACDLIHDETQRDKVGDLLRQVVAREPRFARAESMLAIADALAELPNAQESPVQSEARTMVARALRDDPKDGAPYSALYDLEPDSGRFAERLALLRKGLALSPDDPQLLNRMSELSGELGYMDDAVAYAQRSVNLDPLGPPKSLTLDVALASDDQGGAAERHLEHDIATWPDRMQFTVERAALEARDGDPDLALKIIDDPANRSDFTTPGMLQDFRRMAEVRRTATPAARVAFLSYLRDGVAAGRISRMRALLMMGAIGATDAAFDLVDATPNPQVGSDILFRPESVKMRADPRFVPLVRRLGLAALWRRERRWPDFCASPNLPYRCQDIAP